MLAPRNKSGLTDAKLPSTHVTDAKTNNDHDHSTAGEKGMYARQVSSQHYRGRRRAEARDCNTNSTPTLAAHGLAAVRVLPLLPLRQVVYRVAQLPYLTTHLLLPSLQQSVALA